VKILPDPVVCSMFPCNCMCVLPPLRSLPLPGVFCARGELGSCGAPGLAVVASVASR